MTNPQRSILFAALISLFLLMGQFGALIHSSTHPFHTPTQTCHIWSSIAHSGNVLASSEAAFTISVFRQTTPILPDIPLVAHVPSVYTQRAPPAFS